MPITEQLVLICIFTVLTFIFSSIGIGGGVFYVPILLLMGYAFKDASTLSLAVICVMAASAAVVYIKSRMVDFKLALAMEPFSVLGGVAGGYFSEYVDDRSLTVIFGLVMLACSVLIHFRRERSAAPVKRRFSFNRRFSGAVYQVNVPAAVMLGLLAGLLAGLLGIGGGTVKVPLMLLVFGVPLKVAVATSTFMITVTSVAGFAGHIAQGHGRFDLLMVLALAALAGGQLGSRFMIKVNRKVLVWVLFTALFTVGAYMLYKGIT